ncbi:MAG: hypothetical protein HY822_14890, partial [Acidobacteria bacterium]|nr:hypothetical protein [Acidobacteriota bacterium]
GDKTAYVGGTVKEIREGAKGVLKLDDKKDLVFALEKGKEYRVPYESIQTMEFGQKAGRRVGATVALGITTLGIGALPVLFSKKKKHYLTLSYRNAAGENEAMVLELAKGVVRTTLPKLEARTGKKVELEEATGAVKQACPPFSPTAKSRRWAWRSTLSFEGRFAEGRRSGKEMVFECTAPGFAVSGHELRVG